MSSAEVKTKLAIGVAGVLFASGIVIPVWMIATRPEPPQLGRPVPLGTNELKVGAKVFNPHGINELRWTVTEIDPAHQFPDGEERLGIKLRNTNGSFWAPREKLNKVLVVQ